MYESHFGFHRQPFQCAELTRAFFVSQSIQTILPQLLHALRSDLGIAVLTGPAGVGKTSLLKHLQLLLAKEGRAIVCSGASLETPLNVLQTLHTSLHGRAAQKASIELASRDVSQSRWTLLDQLQKTSELWGPVLLLIDDAQLLPVSVLNELRAFTEEEWNGRSLVRCLIAGPLSLEEELARPTHADFSHRIRCHAFLQPLTSRESLELLNRHINVVGGQLNKVFTAKALELIAVACDGLPRCLSLLADESLVVAASNKRAVADEECVRTALSRLQHLPYPWAASPMTSEENRFESEEDTTTLAAPVRKLMTESSTVAVAASVQDSGAGFVEFGAPSGSVTAGRAFAPVAASSVPLPVKSSSVIEFGGSTSKGTVEAGSFEVGRRFLQEYLDVVDSSEDVMDAEDVPPDVDFADHNMPGINSGYSVSWEKLEDSFAVTEFSRPSQSTPRESETEAVVVHSSTPAASSASIVFTGSSANQMASDAPQNDLTERADDRWISSMAGAGFAQRLPVFDRYTWVALGREVPAGTYAVRSSSVVNRAAYDDAIVQTSKQAARRGRSFDSITTIEMTSEEIDRRLSSVSGTVELGDFFVSRTTDLLTPHDPIVEPDVMDESSRVPAIGVEFFNPPESQPVATTPTLNSPVEPVRSDENRRAIRDAILSRLSQVDSFRDRTDIEDLVDSAISTFGSEKPSDPSMESHWLDGQLVFGKPQTPEVASESLPSSGEDSEQVAINFESARMARQESETQAANDAVSVRGTFFTLPPEVNAITWDLRSEVIESDEFLPLAESLSALQNEVNSFHQNSRRDDNSRWTGEHSADADTSEGDDSLVAQARRRLEAASAHQELPVSNSASGFMSSPGPSSVSLGSVAEESETAAQVEVKPPATFGQLFTRLRQLRKSSGEN